MPIFMYPAIPRATLVAAIIPSSPAPSIAAFAITSMADEEEVLNSLEIEYKMPSPGCCGMAGSFGFEKEKYDVSIAIGELEPFPPCGRLRRTV
jgi:hypothetical protein